MGTFQFEYVFFFSFLFIVVKLYCSVSVHPDRARVSDHCQNLKTFTSAILVYALKSTFTFC